MQYLTEGLLSSIKLRCMVPISQSTFQDADLIQLANEDLQLKLVADIIGERENFFLTTQSVNVKSGMDTYGIPSRAIGNALKLVTYVDAQGNESPLVWVDVDRRSSYASSTSSAGSSAPTAFYFQGDQIVVMPKPNTTSGTIKFDFTARPNQIVATSTCAKITAVSTSSGITTFTVDTDLTASLSVGSLVDLVSLNSPFLLWGYQVPVLAITSTTFQVTASLVSDQSGAVEPVIGDYICPTGTANIPQIPQEFHPVLAQMVANRLLISLGDQQKLATGQAILKEDRENAMKLIKNRVEATPQKVNTRSGWVSVVSRRF